MVITNSKLYDSLKFLAQILLPALGTLYFALAGIWDLPAADKVVGTIVVVDTFLGVVLGISTNAYNKSDLKYDGTVQVLSGAGGGKVYSLELNKEPEDLDGQKDVVLKVNVQQP